MLLGILALLLGLITLLSVPVDLAFRVRRQTSFRTDLTVRWMFGLVEFPLKRRKPRGKPGKPKAQQRKKRGRAARLLPRLLGALQSAKFRHRLLRFCRDIIAALRLRNFGLRLRLGFDDPADTGVVWAFLAPLIAFLQAREAVNIDVGADFERETLEFDAGGKVRIIPAHLGSIALLFALSPVTLRTAWTQFARA